MPAASTGEDSSVTRHSQAVLVFAVLTAFSRALEAFPELPLDQKGITFDHQHLFFFISTVRFELTIS